MAQYQFQIIDFIPSHFTCDAIDTHNGKQSLIHVYAHASGRKSLIGAIYYNPRTSRYYADSITGHSDYFDLRGDAERFCRQSYRQFAASRQSDRLVALEVA